MQKRIALFDLDGTLTPARQPATGDAIVMLQKLRKLMPVGIVTGSDKVKVKEQLQHGLTINDFDFVFVENGTSAYKNGKQISEESLVTFLGENKIQQLINFVLRYLSELELPKKRGTFIEHRCGMINICPIGRSCTLDERIEFSNYDKQHKIRQKMLDALYEKFPKHTFGMQLALGGQISIDCFPIGWDKTYCLKFLENDFEEIHFFGDKVNPGGNDYEIYNDRRTIGYEVENYQDTLRQINKLFGVSVN